MGHSLGGSISLIYAGLYPDVVNKLISIEGIGAPPSWARGGVQSNVHKRLHGWVNDLRQLSARIPRRYATLEDAFHRMQTENPHLTAEQARHLTIHGSNQNEDGTYSWKFDNYVRSFSPLGLDHDEIHALYGRIECPTLLIYGTESWASNPEVDGRTNPFKNVTVRGIENAGHWSHHDQFGEFMRIVREFLAT